MTRITLPLSGMHCASCARTIERGLQQVVDVTRQVVAPRADVLDERGSLAVQPGSSTVTSAAVIDAQNSSKEPEQSTSPSSTIHTLSAPPGATRSNG